MKKVAVLAATFLLASIPFVVNAQENEKKAVKETKKEVKETRKEVKETRKELKENKKDLRAAKKNQVSEFSKRQFEVDFGKNLSPVWSKTTHYDIVEFVKNGQKMVAYYNQSNLIATSMDKTFADLPSKGQKHLKSKYKDYTINSVYFIDYRGSDASGGVQFYGRELDRDNYFVELQNGKKRMIIKVDESGNIELFKLL